MKRIVNSIAIALAIGVPALAQARSDPAAQLADALKDSIAEAPVRCVGLNANVRLAIIGTTTVIARQGRSLVFRNDPPGGCPALTMRTRIVTNGSSSRLCTGDIVNVFDFDTGDPVGGCRLDMWTPYRKQK